MEEIRQKPEDILRQIQDEENHKNKGELKIFFGYAAGVGKTYGMLEAAHEALKKGRDVVAGYIEPHDRQDTIDQIEGLEVLPIKLVPHNNINLKEFDIDRALERNPELILVDELAHTNAPGSRNAKRYQDVAELLNKGIDVYTTINVQHIESLHDIVAAITGISVRERIPDSVFDSADHVEIMDIEPEDLLERLASGKVYNKTQAKRATQNFFTLENLTALREIALRRCADHVNSVIETHRVNQKQNFDCQTEEHVLVGLSSSPSNSKIIRTAARMVKAFKGNFTAIYVETPDFEAMSEEDHKRLKANTRLAEQLGAKIEIVHGEDVAYQIAEFARLSDVTKIVIGRSAAVRGRIFGKHTMVERLIAFAPLLDVYIIPDSTVAKPYRRRRAKEKRKSTVLDLLYSVGVLFAATVLGVIFHRSGFEESNIIMIYVLGVMIISVLTQNRIFSLLCSAISVMVFNFFFTVPYFSLKAYDAGYPVTFAIMFLTALMTSSLAVRLKNHARKSAIVAYRTKILLDTSQSLQQASSQEEIMRTTAKQIIKLVKRDVVTYTITNGILDSPEVNFAPRDKGQWGGAGNDAAIYTSENEKTVAQWVMNNNKHAGATTQTLSNSHCLYLAVRVNQNVYGVIGIAVGKESLDAFEKSILLSILGECALALENDKNAKEKEEAAVIAKNEQLRANLLRAISHDLRTPLTSISGNASNFLSNGDSLDEETKRQLFTDIYDDSMWLINLVENLLSVTRLEDDRLNLNMTSELVADVIDEAMKHLNKKSIEHNISVKYQDEFMLARMDSRLIVQVLINLLDNAIKYTQPGSNICVKVKEQEKMAVFSIADNGSGISDDMKPRIFDMFYSGSNKVVDSRRSLGLGLYLCKSIVTAHGGTIEVKDNLPNGSVFVFTLPIGEVTLHE